MRADRNGDGGQRFATVIELRDKVVDTRAVA
jgi:hypothetical protein